MQLLFGLASLLILLPVLYFLPLGMTSKGKVVLALTAAVFAMAAMYYSEVVPLWQSAVLVIAIVGVTSLIYGRKLGSFFNVPDRIDGISFLHNEKEKSSPSFNNNEPLEPMDLDVVPKDYKKQTLAGPVQDEIQITELLAETKHEEIEAIGLSGNTDVILPVFENDELEPLTPLSTEHLEVQEETGFLDDLDMFGDFEELFEKSIPASPFVDGSVLPFEERDLEILIDSEDAVSPVGDFDKMDNGPEQGKEQYDYLTALLETAASIEQEKAEGPGNG
ncbi:hypothetical protein DRW41_19870 [Neobacillus piezotolerans]|uniref:Uncharacterized protein n=1 Tax=Neobacillus piezotolerans TaxID=2259171 RepID=A0A3D8GL18_9BACI|nr:hypothetical protein [Neobacillus piezotolerans]RDU35041.1 hypothetical protein DRW41_19870 [Neobacillus piezotolerans]